MSETDRIEVVLDMLFESYDEDDVANTIIEKFEQDAEEVLLHYVAHDDIINEALEIRTDEDTKEMLNELKHTDYFNIFTTRIDTQRMLEYLIQYLDEISLEDLEQVIKNK